MTYANDEDRYALLIKAMGIGALLIIMGVSLMVIGKDCCQFLNLSTTGQILIAAGLFVVLLILVLILRPFVEFILNLLFSRNNPEAVTY
jgi:membrane protein implicated in regulation of membrane protease activity